MFFKNLKGEKMRNTNFKIRSMSIILCLIFKFIVLGLSFIFLGRFSSLIKSFSDLEKINLKTLPNSLSSIVNVYYLILLFLILSLILFSISLIFNKSFKALEIVEIGANVLSLIFYVISFILIKPALSLFKNILNGFKGLDTLEYFSYIKKFLYNANFLVDKIDGPIKIFFTIFTILAIIMMIISIILMVKRLIRK